MMRCAALILAGILAGAAGPSSAKLSMGMTGSNATVSAFYASDHGLFARQGLDVSIQITKEGSTAVTGLVSGDFQIAAPSGTVFLQAVDSGLDLLVVSPQYVFPTPTAIGVLAKSGGPIRAAADMIGQRIGVPGRGGLQDILTHQWLAQSKVSPTGVVFVELAFAQMADALRGGQVDAVSANDPVYNRIIQEKLGTPIFDLRTLVPPGAVGGVYATTRDWASHHDADLAAFRRAMADAIEAIRQDPAGAKASIAHFTKLPADVMATMEIPTLSPTIQPEQMAFWIDLMQQQGLLTHSIAPETVIAP
jgi:NitT/TauT family transport system substrate-binding protein